MGGPEPLLKVVLVAVVNHFYNLIVIISISANYILLFYVVSNFSSHNIMGGYELLQKVVFSHCRKSIFLIERKLRDTIDTDE